MGTSMVSCRISLKPIHFEYSKHNNIITEQYIAPVAEQNLENLHGRPRSGRESGKDKWTRQNKVYLNVK
jgi:hypothetical protein